MIVSYSWNEKFAKVCIDYQAIFNAITKQ